MYEQGIESISAERKIFVDTGKKWSIISLVALERAKSSRERRADKARHQAELAKIFRVN